MNKGFYLLPWLHRAFRVINSSGNEVQMHCPICGHSSFYFSTSKKVGYCHSARCGFSPTLDALIRLIGYGPTDYGVELEPEEEEEIEIEVVLPGWPLIKPNGGPGEFLTDYPEAVGYLQSRNLKLRDILRFGMTYDGARIYVPVYSDGVLKNYVGRDITGCLYLKYKYCKGVKTSEHLFGWDEAQNWNTLTLVENTFVSIWLRNILNCSTNFGSWLSETQINLISKSKIKRVVFFWDEGAGVRAENAVKKLEAKGVEAVYVEMKGQPDDHSLEELEAYWIGANEMRDNGGIRYNAEL